MKQFTISILVFITCLTTYGQVKVNPNGKFFNYNGTKIYYKIPVPESPFYYSIIFLILLTHGNLMWKLTQSNLGRLPLT